MMWSMRILRDGADFIGHCWAGPIIVRYISVTAVKISVQSVESLVDDTKITFLKNDAVLKKSMHLRKRSLQRMVLYFNTQIEQKRVIPYIPLSVGSDPPIGILERPLRPQEPSQRPFPTSPALQKLRPKPTWMRNSAPDSKTTTFSELTLAETDEAISSQGESCFSPPQIFP